MTTVRVLIEGVGEWEKDQVVRNAPAGLVFMAENKKRNAATGDIIAEIVADDENDLLDQLKTRAKELKITGYGNMKIDTLQAAVTAAEEAAAQLNTKPDDPSPDQKGEGTQGQGGNVGGQPTTDQ